MFSKKTMCSFYAKFQEDEDSECWVWTAAQARGGYGSFFTSRLDGARWYRAHRFSYEAFVGEIPDGAVLMHSCDNPRCVNPKHLSVGTQAENISYRDRKRCHATKYKFSMDDLSYVLSTKDSDTSVAKKFQCSTGLIWKIKNKKLRWVNEMLRDAT